eukprot:s7396_g1.t1
METLPRRRRSIPGHEQEANSGFIVFGMAVAGFESLRRMAYRMMSLWQPMPTHVLFRMKDAVIHSRKLLTFASKWWEPETRG